jgi:hypothetical protein
VDSCLTESHAGVSKTLVHDSPDDSVFLPPVSFGLLSFFILLLAIRFQEVDQFIISLTLQVERFICQPFYKLHFFGFLVGKAYAIKHHFPSLERIVSLEDLCRVLVDEGFHQEFQFIFEHSLLGLPLLNLLVEAHAHEPRSDI